MALAIANIAFGGHKPILGLPSSYFIDSILPLLYSSI
jgi:hypothetical protein